MDNICILCDTVRNTRFNCGHSVYCDSCIKIAITTSTLCPFCRLNVTTYIKTTNSDIFIAPNMELSEYCNDPNNSDLELSDCWQETNEYEIPISIPEIPRSASQRNDIAISIEEITTDNSTTTISVQSRLFVYHNNCILVCIVVIAASFGFSFLAYKIYYE